MIFLVGHRASGKSVAASYLSKRYNFLHVETGNIVRNYKQATSSEQLSMSDWEREVITKFGPRFIDNLIIQTIHKSYRSELAINPTLQDLLITGNRQLSGIQTIIDGMTEVQSTQRKTIVAILANDNVLYSRYINRNREIDDTTITFEEFQKQVIEAEKKKGLEDLVNAADYKIQNDKDGRFSLYTPLSNLFDNELGYIPQRERLV